MTSAFEIIWEVTQRTGRIYLGILLGYLFVISPLEKYRKQFISLTINIMTPLLIIVSIIRISSTLNWTLPIIAIIIVTIAGLLVPKFLAKVMRSEEKPSPAEISTATFPNALNFPFPVVFALSPDGLGPAGLFLAMSIISRNTVGFWIAGSKMKKEDIKQILLFPPIWGILIAVFIRIFALTQFGPIVEHQIVNIFFEIGIFMTLMTIGFSLRKPKWEYRLPIFRVGITRYLVCGIIASLVIIIFHPPRYIGVPFVVQMIAPPAVYNGLYAEKLKLNTELTTQVIVTLTLIALILLPIELLILNSIFIN